MVENGGNNDDDDIAGGGDVSGPSGDVESITLKCNAYSSVDGS